MYGVFPYGKWMSMGGLQLQINVSCEDYFRLSWFILLPV